MPKAGAYPIANTTDGRIKWSDGSITGGMSTPQGYASPTIMPNTTMRGGFQVPNRLINSTAIPGGGGTAARTTVSTATSAPSAPSGPSAEDLARQLAEAQYRAAIEQAGRVRESGKATFNDLLKAVNSFRERAGGLRDAASQEIINRASGLLGDTARTGREEMATARSRGRALGLGAGSRFLNQNRIGGAVAANIGDLVAKRGEQQNQNQLLYQQRQDEAQTQEGEANRFLRDVEDSARGVETAGLEGFGGALNNLIARQQALAALKPLNAGALTQMQPDFTGIANTIGQVSGALGARAGGEDSAANLYSPLTFPELLARRRANPYNPYA